jgi:hypothetical protein
MTTGTRRVVGLVSALALVSCGGDANSPREAASDAATAPPAQTTFARKLGGAGLEWGLGLAAAPDGGLVAVSGIGGFMNRPQQLGISRLDAAGRTSWARAYGTGTAEVRVAAVAVSPLGNVFLALHVTGSTYPSGSLDLGGGPTEGDVVVKLAPDGRFVWQRFLSGPISSLAVDGSGSALVGYLDVGDLGTEARALKIRWDDALLWQRAVTEPEGLTDQVAVAWDPAGNAVVGNGRTLWRLDPDGRFLWAIRLDAPHAQIWWVGATAKGTVVASGQYDASLAYAGTRLVPPATAPCRAGSPSRRRRTVARAGSGRAPRPARSPSTPRAASRCSTSGSRVRAATRWRAGISPASSSGGGRSRGATRPRRSRRWSGARSPSRRIRASGFRATRPSASMRAPGRSSLPGAIGSSFASRPDVRARGDSRGRSIDYKPAVDGGPPAAYLVAPA